MSREQSTVRLGAVFPQTDLGGDAEAIRAYGVAAEELGFDHLLAYEHVVGAPRPEGWGDIWPYSQDATFCEPFVLFSYLAGCTTRLGFASAVLILSQRATVLVAKQAASLDVVSGGGRFRLGVGTGWNPLEYEAMGATLRDRGALLEEQVSVLRALWTEELVTFSGRWHTLRGVGIKPLPLGSIPLWFGGSADRVLKRIAAVGDGWIATSFPSPDAARPALDLLHGYLEDAGRDPSDIGLEFRIPYGDGRPDHWGELLEQWRDHGATHVSFNPMDTGLSTDGHIEALRTFAEIAS